MTSPFSLKRLDAVEAFWERHIFFEEKKYDDLANGALITAYGMLIHFMLNPEAKHYKREAGNWTRKIILRLICKGNLRSLKLAIIYFIYLLT